MESDSLAQSIKRKSIHVCCCGSIEDSSPIGVQTERFRVKLRVNLSSQVKSRKSIHVKKLFNTRFLPNFKDRFHETVGSESLRAASRLTPTDAEGQPGNYSKQNWREFPIQSSQVKSRESSPVKSRQESQSTYSSTELRKGLNTLEKLHCARLPNKTERSNSS